MCEDLLAIASAGRLVGELIVVRQSVMNMRGTGAASRRYPGIVVSTFECLYPCPV
jgi:hypothetical protein